MFELDVAGLDGWVPVRIDLEEAELAADFNAHRGVLDSPMGYLMATMAASLRRRDADDEMPPLLAMWARVDDAQQVVPTCVATLRMLSSSAPDPLTFAQGLTASWPLFRPYEIEDLATESGPAHCLSAALQFTDGSTDFEFHQKDVVFWLRPHEADVLLLTTETTDLVRGRALTGEFRQLAQGVGGFR